jgi:hypothetical protein
LWVLVSSRILGSRQTCPPVSSLDQNTITTLPNKLLGFYTSLLFLTSHTSGVFIFTQCLC